MFEGKPPIAANALSSAFGPFADEELFAFSWDDLVARLSASQDLRAALAHVPSAARASFDAQAAQRLANRRSFADCSGKHGVNLAPSGNGKGNGARDSAGADRAWPTVRGIT